MEEQINLKQFIYDTRLCVLVLHLKTFKKRLRHLIFYGLSKFKKILRVNTYDAGYNSDLSFPSLH